MRKFIFVATLCITFCISCFAQMGTNSKDLSIKVIKTNGEVIEATLVPPRFNFDLNYIIVTDGHRKTKIKKKNIDKLFVEGDEYVSKSVYSASGKKILKKKQLVKVEITGKASLYSHTYAVSEVHMMKGGVYLKRTVYYCQKEGEEALTLLHYNYENFDRNYDFKATATAYFSDNESVAEKIDTGIFTYRNIPSMIREYNRL